MSFRSWVPEFGILSYDGTPFTLPAACLFARWLILEEGTNRSLGTPNWGSNGWDGSEAFPATHFAGSGVVNPPWKSLVWSGGFCGRIRIRTLPKTIIAEYDIELPCGFIEIAAPTDDTYGDIGFPNLNNWP